MPGLRVKVMSSMNTDYMNFNFVGSLKLLKKKKKMKRKETQIRNSTKQTKNPRYWADVGR